MNKNTVSTTQTSFLKSFYTDFWLQFKLGIYSSFILLFFAVGVFTFIYFTLNGFADFAISIIQIEPSAKELLLKYLADTQFWLLICLFGFLVLNIILSCFYIHRLISPNIIFREHIRNLIDRNYETRIQIRKGDSFKDLANDLNRLAIVLSQREDNAKINE